MAARRFRVFISSVQKEFEQVRQDIKAYVLGDPVLRRFISEVFLFEDLPARDQRSDHVYLKEVEKCDIYLGIFGQDYGFEDEKGISPTEHEYVRAGEREKERIIYVWGTDEKRRDPKMKKLIRQASKELVRRRVNDTSSLITEVYASLIDYFDRLGVLRVPPFDRSPCDNASLRNLSRKRIDWFLRTARETRKFPLKVKTPTIDLLRHLNLLDEGNPTNAAIMLFGAAPQRFHRPTEIKCMHCHGTEYQRPFASQHRYEGDVFALVDQGVEFIFARIDRTVGTRTEGTISPVRFELPPDAIQEALVNAVAHRDYLSVGSVEVRLFSDRLEVWNPGTLPEALTLESLRDHHSSRPANPLIAESLYLAGYIEKAGTGTLEMIRWCREAGLPEPDFEIRSGSFVVTLWRDWLTPAVLSQFDLNERQLRAIELVKTGRQLTNAEYRKAMSVSESTALRELRHLTKTGIFQKTGVTGRSVRYTIAKNKPVINPSKPSKE